MLLYSGLALDASRSDPGNTVHETAVDRGGGECQFIAWQQKAVFGNKLANERLVYEIVIYESYIEHSLHAQFNFNCGPTKHMTALLCYRQCSPFNFSLLHYKIILHFGYKPRQV